VEKEIKPPHWGTKLFLKKKKCTRVLRNVLKAAERLKKSDNALSFSQIELTHLPAEQNKPFRPNDSNSSYNSSAAPKKNGRPFIRVSAQKREGEKVWLGFRATRLEEVSLLGKKYP
jgi:hypothetical protein